MAIKRKLQVGLRITLDETTDELLARQPERNEWSTNGLKPRSELKLKLTKQQRKVLQTPAYMR